MTPSGITPKQGDILLVPVPFTDLSSSKRRPVLVLSSSAYNRRSPDIIVAAITSNPTTQNALPLAQNDLKMEILPVKSFVRPGNIYTLSKSIIVKRIGTAHSTIIEQVLARLNRLFEPSES